MQLTHFDAQDTRLIPPLTKRPLGDAIRSIERAMKARCSNANLVLQQLMRVTLGREGRRGGDGMAGVCGA